MAPRQSLIKFAQLLYRPQRETSQLLSRGALLQNLVLLAAVISVALALVLPALLSIQNQWAATELAVRINKPSWHAYFGQSDNSKCAPDAATPNCPAHEGFSGWKTAISRADKGYRTQVRRQGAAEFWLRTEVPAADLQQAYAKGATVLYLGTIRGTYSLWIDHSFYFSSSSRVYQQIAIPVAQTRLIENRPLAVTIKIMNDVLHGHPDLLGADQGEGFMTADQAVAFTQSKDYAARVPALLFGLANFILGAIFLGLWAISPERPEYFFVSLYALVTSVLSFLLVDTLIVALTPLGSARAYMTLMIFKATAAILLSLAFARVRTLLSWLVIAAAALATAGLLHFHNPLELILFSYGQIQWIIPLAALLGSLVCMHQALYLAKSDKPRTWHPKRIKRLSLFSLSFGVTFLVASIAILLEPVTAKWNHYYRVSDLLLIYVVAAIVFSEYRDRERQLAAAPGSEYHKRPVLPEQVIGAILTVDLKNSEPLYKMRAESSSDQHPVVQWRTHMNAAILRCSGTIIRNKGDEISVLFDQSKTRNPAATAMNAALEIFHASSRLEDEFRLQGLLPPGVAGLRCRISVVEGALRPIFEKYGNTLEPQWEESGSSTPLLTTARLLEMEKAVSSPEQSALIMTEALATASEAAFSPLAALKFTRTRTCRDKHGQRHELAVMSYQQLTGGESLAA